MLLYAEDEVWKVQLAVSEGAAWAKVGIEVEPIGRPFFTVTQTALPCRTPGTPACAWAMANWGGWTFLPDYMPTGEYLFSAGGVDNVGSYDDAETDRLIVASERSDNLGSLYRYEDYLAKQLPVLWQPSNAVTAFEVSKSLDGVGQLSPLLTLTPEYWYWTTASHP